MSTLLSVILADQRKLVIVEQVQTLPTVFRQDVENKRFNKVRIHMASQFSVHVYVKNLPVGISSDCDVHRSNIKKASDGRVGKNRKNVGRGYLMNIHNSVSKTG